MSISSSFCLLEASSSWRDGSASQEYRYGPCGCWHPDNHRDCLFHLHGLSPGIEACTVLGARCNRMNDRVAGILDADQPPLVQHAALHGGCLGCSVAERESNRRAAAMVTPARGALAMLAAAIAS